MKEPPPDSLSPERAKYNKELMTKTLRGEAPIIGTFIVKKEKPQPESWEEDEEVEEQAKTVEKMNSIEVKEEKEEEQEVGQEQQEQDEDDELKDEEYYRRLRSNEIRKRFYLKVAREYSLQEFFDDEQCTAKMQATVEADFKYGEKRRDEQPEETCKIRWEKFMNVLLPNRTNKQVVDMIHFMHNEYGILHRNMPFMFKKMSPEEIK